MAKSKRLLVISDLHCGHISGLRKEKGFGYWDLFSKEIDRLRPFDVCLCNGDLIDGKGERSGGTEQLTTDRRQQKDMAIEVLDYIDAKQYLFTYGTPYHVGKEEDWEALVADKFSARISGQDYFQINGVTFHAKHKISGSTIPHGRFTALARQKTWNLFWNEYDEVPKVNVFIRSHVHYFAYCGDESFLAVITPALQGWGSKYGERQCEGTVGFGFVVFDVASLEDWKWTPYVFRDLQRATVSKY
jgi:hypothetical protein